MKDVKALEEAARTAIAGDAQTSGERGKQKDPEEQKKREEMEATVGAYQTAVERAWEDVARLEEESQHVQSLEKESVRCQLLMPGPLSHEPHPHTLA